MSLRVSAPLHGTPTSNLAMIPVAGRSPNTNILSVKKRKMAQRLQFKG